MGYRNHVGKKKSYSLGTSICDVDDIVHCVVEGGSDRNIHQIFLCFIRPQMNPRLQQLACHLTELLNTIGETIPFMFLKHSRKLLFR